MAYPLWENARPGVEGGKISSSLDTNLLDVNWQEVQPHQWTPVNADRLESLLEVSAYGKTQVPLLGGRFHAVFSPKKRLNRSIHQLVGDRTANARWVRCNNKTALANPNAVEAKLWSQKDDQTLCGAGLPDIYYNATGPSGQ